MPQMYLPIFPAGVTHINSEIAFQKKQGIVYYFNNLMPIFIHEEHDTDSFKMIMSQFYINGNVKQAEIVRAFGVTPIVVKRAVKLYKEKGPRGFYEPRNTRGPVVLNPPTLAKAQDLLDSGLEIKDIADKLRIKRDTLRKAVNSNRLHKSEKKKKKAQATNKTCRSVIDNQAPMGMGATNVIDRVAASLGQLTSVTPSFESSSDVPNAGALLALPGLFANGLFRNTDKFFCLSKGYYGLSSIFLLIALMSLSRIKTVEDLRYCAPGEWGKILGLDRIPEARTMREKIAELANQSQSKEWSAELCSEWMQTAPEEAAVLYVDGHVRVYHGKKATLPKHFVARQKLCLRATTDYWINAMDGQPFFVVNKDVDPGLLRTLEEDILPKLEDSVPNQPTEAELQADPLLHRFTIIFDREGYSPAFFKRMRDKRIACQTYHKFPKDNWEEGEFRDSEIKLSSGDTVNVKIAERGTLFQKQFWIREVRKLCRNGHQTSILSSNYKADLEQVGSMMFSRWSQENFFKYMRAHYSLDRLVNYHTEDIPDTTEVVNPEYRALDSKVRRQLGILNRKTQEFGALSLKEDIEPKNVEKYESKKAELKEEIEHLQSEVEKLKSKRKHTQRHITVDKLPKEDRLNRLSSDAKHLVDVIKMIAYRSETSTVQILREKMSRKDDARRLAQTIYKLHGDIIPDEANSILTIRLHHLANAAEDQALSYLCEELNDTETIFPGTDLRLVYELVSQ